MSCTARQPWRSSANPPQSTGQHQSRGRYFQWGERHVQITNHRATSNIVSSCLRFSCHVWFQAGQEQKLRRPWTLWFTFIQYKTSTHKSRGYTVGRCTIFSLQKGKTGPVLPTVHYSPLSTFSLCQCEMNYATLFCFMSFQFICLSFFFWLVK